MTKRWARFYDVCIRCAQTTSKHHAHGLCRRCSHYVKDPEQENARKRVVMHKKRFGSGNRELVFARSYGKCVKCGGTAEVIHHMDNDGIKDVSLIDRWLDNIGRDPARMEALCRSCHRLHHTRENRKKLLNEDTR